MKNYLELLKNILDNGQDYDDRTGVGRRSIFGAELRFDLSTGTFPLVTTRKMFIKGVVAELLWFISGSVNTKPLTDKGVNFWDSWTVKEEDIDDFIAKFHGDEDDEHKKSLKAYHLNINKNTIGRLYGSSFRNLPVDSSTLKVGSVGSYASLAEDKQRIVFNIFNNESVRKQFVENFRLPADLTTIDDLAKAIYGGRLDQMQELIINLKKRPYSSRHVVSAWIPNLIPDEDFSPQENVLMGFGALAPCHVLQQYYVTKPKVAGGKMKLSLKLTQRSADFLVGVPTNIASYSLLLMMIAQVVGMEVGEFIWSGGDVHVYKNHIENANLQLQRVPLNPAILMINPEVKDLFSFTQDDFRIASYQHYDPISYQLAV